MQSIINTFVENQMWGSVGNTSGEGKTIRSRNKEDNEMGFNMETCKLINLEKIYPKHILTGCKSLGKA